MTEAANPVSGAALRSTLVRNTLANGLNYALVVLSAVVLTPLVIRGFGAAVYGVWILVNQLTAYAGVLDMGVQPAVSKRVAEARADGNRTVLRDFLASALCLHGTVAATTFLLGLALSVGLPHWFHLEGVSPRDARLAVVIAGLTTALSFPSGVLSSVLKGELRFDLGSWINIVGQVARVIGIGLVLHWGGGVAGLALCSLLSAAVVLVGHFFVARRLLGGVGFLRGGRPSWTHVRSIARFGGLTMLSMTGAYLAYSTDAAVIGATLTVADVAHFGLAMNVLVILSGVVSSFSGTLMPVAAQLETGGRRADTQNTYLLGTRVCLTLTVPAVLAFVLAGPELLSAWVGRDFGTAAGKILQVLAIAFLPVIANGPGFHMGIGIGLNRPIALLSLAEGILNLALSYTLARRIGVIGVAIGTLIPSFISHGIAMPALVRAHLGVSAWRFLRQAIAPAVWPLVPAAVVAVALWTSLHPTQGLAKILWAAAVVLSYGLVAGIAFLAGRNRSAQSA